MHVHLCTCLEDATNSKIWEKEEETKREMGSEEEMVKVSAWDFMARPVIAKLAARHTVAHCYICTTPSWSK